MPRDLPLSTGPSAARAYRCGVAHLLADDAGPAACAFRRAVEEDPCFAVGLAGLAVALASLDQPPRPGPDDVAEQLARADQCSRRVSPPERHHVEVVLLGLTGRWDRASALAREHLVDVPGDGIVGYVLARWCDDEREAASSSVEAEPPRA